MRAAAIETGPVERAVPRRWSAEWMAYVAETGRWDLPRIHRSPEFVALSPWPATMINAAMLRAREVFTPDVGRRVFSDPSEAPTLYSLLLALSAPSNSGLVRVALDLLHAGRIPARLAERLGVEDSHWGARFELAVLAAVRRAGLRRAYEPLRRRDARGPDLLVGLEEPVFIELKAVNTSEAWRQRERTYETIISGGRTGHGMIDLASVDLDFTDEFRRLDATDGGRCELARIADRLGRSVAAAARVMAGDSVVVDDLVRLTVAPGGRHGRRPPLAPLYGDEVARVVERTVLDACEQLPRGHHGLAIVETERSWASVGDLQQATGAWLEGPIGRQYDHVAGVLFTYRPWWTDLPCLALVSVWNRRAPRWLRRSRRLGAIAEGLRWADLCALRR